ncbi:hypothetical protein Dimus_011289 [Dionaea muscipula]
MYMMLWKEILLFSLGFLLSYVCLAPFAFPSVPTGAPSVPICLHLHAEQSKGEAEAETEGRSRRSPTIVSKLGSVEKVKVSDERPPVLCSGLLCSLCSKVGTKPAVKIELGA